jgi:hypothetical protein
MASGNGFRDKNSMIRSSLEAGGITEDEFIEKFDEVMDFIGFRMFNPYNPQTGSLASLERVPMPAVLERIYRMNPTLNKWADINNLSDKLRVFLKLRNEEI